MRFWIQFFFLNADPDEVWIQALEIDSRLWNSSFLLFRDKMNAEPDPYLIQQQPLLYMPHFFHSFLPISDFLMTSVPDPAPGFCRLESGSYLLPRLIN